MKAEFHEPCEIHIVCTCGRELDVIEIQNKGICKTLYIDACPTCQNLAYIAGYNEVDC